MLPEAKNAVNKTEQVVQYSLLCVYSAPFFKWSHLVFDGLVAFTHLKRHEAKELTGKHVC